MRSSALRLGQPGPDSSLFKFTIKQRPVRDVRGACDLHLRESMLFRGNAPKANSLTRAACAAEIVSRFRLRMRPLESSPDGEERSGISGVRPNASPAARISTRAIAADEYGAAFVSAPGLLNVKQARANTCEFFKYAPIERLATPGAMNSRFHQRRVEPACA